MGVKTIQPNVKEALDNATVEVDGIKGNINIIMPLKETKDTMGAVIGTMIDPNIDDETVVFVSTKRALAFYLADNETVIEFRNGEFRTNNKKIIEELRTNPAYPLGVLYWEGDYPEAVLRLIEEKKRDLTTVNEDEELR